MDDTNNNNNTHDIEALAKKLSGLAAMFQLYTLQLGHQLHLCPHAMTAALKELTRMQEEENAKHPPCESQEVIDRVWGSKEGQKAVDQAEALLRSIVQGGHA